MTLQNFTLGTFAQGAAGGGGAFESIATVNGTGSSATITFSSIPSTYQHLQIRTLGISASSDAAVYVRCNGVSTSSYTQHQLFGNGTNVLVSASAPGTEIYGLLRSTATYPSVAIIDILDYSNTSKNKTIRSFMGEDANGSGRVGLFSGLFMSTSAISSITLVASQNYSTSTTFALYGIKGA